MPLIVGEVQKVGAKAIGVASMAVSFLGALFALSLVFNLLWEFAHVHLYVTEVCSVFLVWQSIKDALWITLAYVLLPFPFLFVIGLLIFSYAVELHAIKTKRWEYASAMPLVFGVGFSPLVELAVTGFVAVAVLMFLGM